MITKFLKVCIVLALTLGISFIAAGCENLNKAGRIPTSPNKIISADEEKYFGSSDDSSNDNSGTHLNVAEKEPSKYADFAIKKGVESLIPYDLEKNIDLFSFLGRPVNEEETQLGTGADTFSGSYIKELVYDGIEVKLFAPAGEEKNYWIYYIKVTGNDFIAGKGIRIGDSVENLKSIYPEIKIANDGRVDENNCSYVVSMLEEYLYMLYEVNNGKVVEIEIFVEFP